MARHFLYLTNSRVISLQVRGGTIAARHEFPASVAGVGEFSRFVESLPTMPTRILTDLAEEDFRLDTIPHVRGGDRDTIVTRKLGQMFRNTPFRYAQVQGRELEGRRDDRVVYTAVTNAEMLRPWVDVLNKREVPLVGIHSSAVSSAAMLKALDVAAPHVLLVTFTPGEAMRQTFFRDGEIRFSRLTPVDLQPGQTLGAMIGEETTRTWQYLDSLRHFGPEDELEVVVLVHPREIAAAQPELRSLANIRYTLLDIHGVAAKLGLKPPPAGSTAEEIMVLLFVRRPMPNHFATAEMLRHGTLRSIRIGLLQASSLVLLAGMGWAAINVVRAFHVDAGDAGLTQQIASLGSEADSISRAMPSFDVAGATMRDAVQFYNGSIRPFPTTGAFLRDISRVLAVHPEVRLVQVSWKAADTDKATPFLAPTPTREALPVKALAPADASQQQTEEANPPFSGGRVEVALVEATLLVKNNDFRAAAAQAERVAQDFAAIPGMRADVSEPPLDLRTSLVLRGRHGETEPGELPARFVVRLVRERGAAP